MKTAPDVAVAADDNLATHFTWVQRQTAGMRAILEDVMLDVMYDIPSQPNIKEVLIAEEVITKREQPIVLYQKTAETA